MKSHILNIMAHPAFERSVIHKSIKDAVGNLPFVTFHDLYECYPGFMIDVKKEQSMLLAHDHIVFQFPIFWYSCPSLLKEWIDLVLQFGFAYGDGGDRLAGKTLSLVVSCGGQEASYKEGGLAKYELSDFLKPFKQTASLCKLNFLDLFVIYGAHSLKANNEQQSIIENAENLRLRYVQMNSDSLKKREG